MLKYIRKMHIGEIKMKHEALFKIIDEALDEYVSLWEEVCNI